MGLFSRSETVVVVCTANVTRSPYIAYRLERELATLEGFRKHLPSITSAGVHAIPGMILNPVLHSMLQLRGDDLHHHQSQPFDDVLAKKADLVLTAEPWHAEELKQRFPGIARRIATVLGYGRPEISDDDQVIQDPTGRDAEHYQKFLDLADAQAQRLRRLFRKHQGFPLPDSFTPDPPER